MTLDELEKASRYVERRKANAATIEAMEKFSEKLPETESISITINSKLFSVSGRLASDMLGLAMEDVAFEQSVLRMELQTLGVETED